MPFITFEGLDAAGKSTQLELLQEKLLQAGCETLCTRESGGTPLGEEIRSLVQGRHDLTIHPLSEALLYAADRAQHVSEVVRPALDQNVFVLCDRYIDSSLAFQGVALPLQTIRDINRLATEGLQAELTILLDLRVDVSRERLGQRQAELDRIEIRNREYQEQVRTIYLQLATEEPERFLILDATADVANLATAIWQEVQRRFLITSVGAIS